ncbi:AfsR/SARP family transcriptional regulator [Amycolatopsis cihanbeyliensis]|uniref:AfsR/SARP family transcriptional regulator n=1 Tax=Amycolatopsis cihanbeyliensis TaxID=1128664 RepID=UPI001FEB8185|nr:AfsR/SARP family transcriptional regulator [Amycolatopsis cihanbeyliensis]
MLRAGDGCCDAIEFDRLAAWGNRLLDNEEHHGAAEALRAALALWRGPALVDIETGPVLTGEVIRLEERRRLIVERRIELELLLGRHHAIVDDLSALAALDRTHESVHGQLMVALYRCGRRTQALEVFSRLRTAMLDELGLEPAPWLHELQRAVLDAEPGLELESYGIRGLLARR